MATFYAGGVRVIPDPSASQSSTYYRSDGVRIAHDPYAEGMADKYGRRGETDSDGFDPYADSVGAGSECRSAQRAEVTNAAGNRWMAGRACVGYEPV